MQQQKSVSGPKDSGYKARLKRRMSAKNLGDLTKDRAEQDLPVTPVQTTPQPVAGAGIRSAHRVADNVVFVYFRKQADEPTILLSIEDDQEQLRLPVFFRRSFRLEKCSIGKLVSVIGKIMTYRVGHGVRITEVFQHAFCDFFPEGLALHEGQTSAWAVNRLDTGVFDEWCCVFGRDEKIHRTFKTRWYGISEITPETIRPLHRRVILLSIGILKQVYNQRFNAELNAFAKRLKESLG